MSGVIVSIPLYELTFLELLFPAPLYAFCLPDWKHSVTEREIEPTIYPSKLYQVNKDHEPSVQFPRSGVELGNLSHAGACNQLMIAQYEHCKA